MTKMKGELTITLPDGKITKLPSLRELSMAPEMAFKEDQFNALLNSDPPSEWVKEHPFAKDKSGKPTKYLPIDKVEFLLTKIFQIWQVEILREGVLFNSVYVAVRLHYRHPISLEMLYHDGLGAVGVQTDAGEKASNMSAIKQDAIMKALPSAESYAVKDAAEKFGRLFGKDLNRRDVAHFTIEKSSYKEIFS